MKNQENDVTRAIEEYVGRGGWRNGGRPKANYQTTTMRVDIRLKDLIETLKTGLKSGRMSAENLKIFEDLAAQ